MNWEQFLKAAYPEDLRVEDVRERTIIFRWHRWIGLRLAYVFYHLRLSANFISIGRVFISLISFYFIFLTIRGDILLPLIGVFLLYGQNILDYADGAVARASGTVNKLGERLDDIASDVSRFAILVLLAAFTGNIFLVVTSIFVSYLLVVVRNEFIRAKIAYDTEFKGFAIFFRVIFSIQVMLFILPLFIILINILNWQIVMFSYIVTGIYAGLVVFWFSLCVWRKKI